MREGLTLFPSTFSQFNIRSRAVMNLKSQFNKNRYLFLRWYMIYIFIFLFFFLYNISERKERLSPGESVFFSPVHEGTKNPFNPRPERIWIQRIIWETELLFLPVLKLLGKVQEKFKKMSFPLLNNLFAVCLLAFSVSLHPQSCNELGAEGVRYWLLVAVGGL